MIFIENSHLKVGMKTQGAELTSIYNKNNNTEYLWQADSSVWGRHAPILFPIVGRLKDLTTHIDGTAYNIPQHGFARDMNFELINHTETSATFELIYTEETLKKYPYKFKLQIIYTLKDAKLDVAYRVSNTDQEEMYFSIGAHPGFNCPLAEGETLEDYYLEFEKDETVDTYQLNASMNVDTKAHPFLQGTNKLDITSDIFDKGAFILLDLKSNSIALKSKKSEHSVTVEYTGFPYMGIWGQPKDSPFVCIEPWFGVADFEDTDQNYKNKFGIQKIAANEVFESTYTIGIR